MVEQPPLDRQPVVVAAERCRRLRTTRWHGTNGATRLRAHALPAARTAAGLPGLASRARRTTRSCPAGIVAHHPPRLLGEAPPGWRTGDPVERVDVAGGVRATACATAPRSAVRTTPRPLRSPGEPAELVLERGEPGRHDGAVVGDDRRAGPTGVATSVACRGAAVARSCGLLASAGRTGSGRLARVVPQVQRRRRPARAASGRGRRRGAASRRRSTRSVAGQASGSAERAHRDVLGGPGPDAGQREQPGARLGAVGARVEHAAGRRPPRRPGRAAHATRAPVSPRAGPSRSAAASASAVGNAVVSAPSGSSSGVAVRRDQPAGQRAGARHRDLLAEDRTHRELEPVDRAGHPQARAAPRRAAPAPGRSASTASIDGRVRVQVEQPAQPRRPPCPGRTGPAGAAARSRGPAPGVTSTTAAPCRVADDAAQRSAPSASSTPATARGRGSRSSSAAPYGSRCTSRSTSAAGPPVGRRPRRRSGRAAQLGRRAAELLAHHVVELPDAGEPGRERDLGHRQRRLVDRAAARSARAGSGPARSGPTPDLGDQRRGAGAAR